MPNNPGEDRWNETSKKQSLFLTKCLDLKESTLLYGGHASGKTHAMTHLFEQLELMGVDYICLGLFDVSRMIYSIKRGVNVFVFAENALRTTTITPEIFAQFKSCKGAQIIAELVEDRQSPLILEFYNLFTSIIHLPDQV